jgi:hypothetical protein
MKSDDGLLCTWSLEGAHSLILNEKNEHKEHDMNSDSVIYQLCELEQVTHLQNWKIVLWQL